MAPEQKKQMREDLISDMESSSELIKAYEIALEAAAEHGPELIPRIENLISIERAKLQAARIKMNKLRRGQV